MAQLGNAASGLNMPGVKYTLSKPVLVRSMENFVVMLTCVMSAICLLAAYLYDGEIDGEKLPSPSSCLRTIFLIVSACSLQSLFVCIF